jgi:HEAT repeat protein
MNQKIDDPKNSPEIDHSTILKMVEKHNIEAILSVVKTSGNPAVLKHAINFLGENKVKKAVEPLIVLLLSEFGSVREFSAQALGQIGNKKAIKPLSMLLNQEKEDDMIRKEVLKSLVVLDGDGVANPINKILTSELGSTALAVLREIGEPSVKYLIITLHHALQLGSVSLVDDVIKVLGEIGESAKAATEPLLKILKTTGNMDLRGLILNTIALIKDPEAVEFLIESINPNTTHNDNDYAVQNHIIFALGDIGDKQAIDILVQLMLRNSEMRVRGTAAAALGKISDEQAIEPLISVLENDREDSWVRDKAAWALFQIGGAKTALPLLRYLKHNHTNILNSLKDISFPSEIQMLSSFH